MATIRGNGKANHLTGTAASDHMQGRGGNDTIEGLGGNDLIQGGKGDDLLIGGAGDDTLEGGGGFDIAVLPGLREDYTITQIDGDTVLVSGPDGTDEISGVESFQFDDVTQSFAELLQPWQPNLTAENLQVSDVELELGESATITWDIASNGDAGANASVSELVVATAPDASAIIQTIDTEILSYLSTGSSSSLSATLNHGDLAPGTYWVAAKADAGDDLGESNEGDNLTDWVQITIVAPPNVQTTNVSLDETTFPAGEEVTLNWDIVNAGAGEAASSTGAILIASAPDLGAVLGQVGGQDTGLITAGGTASFAETLDLSAYAPGTYFLAVSADDADVLNESDEGDNLSGWIEITIEPREANLSVSTSLDPTGDFDLTGGASFDVSYTVSNTGNVGDEDYTVSVYLSADGSVSGDDLLLFQNTHSTSPGAVDVHSDTGFVPAGYFGGDYQIITVIDWPTSEVEVDLTDNVSLTPVTLTGGSFLGTAGNDLASGSDDDQTFDMLAGDDTVVASGGSDTILGGEGEDTVDYSGWGQGIELYTSFGNPGDAAPIVVTKVPGEFGPPSVAAQVDEVWGVENFIGSEHADGFSFWGEEAVNVDGRGGDDFIGGSLANDTINGGEGSDSIVGFQGDDIIATGAGPDHIVVDRESDGQGGFTGHGHDVVTDFNPTMDTLYVEYWDFVETYDPFADLTQTADGALLTMADDSSILLLGVDVSELNASNLIAYPEEFVSF